MSEYNAIVSYTDAHVFDSGFPSHFMQVEQVILHYILVKEYFALRISTNRDRGGSIILVGGGGGGGESNVKPQIWGSWDRGISVISLFKCTIINSQC